MSLVPAFRPRRSPRSTLLLAGAAIGLLAGSVWAQGGAQQPRQPGGDGNGRFNGGGGGPGGGFPGGRGFMGGLRDMMSPTYTAEMVERYAQMLSLTQDQKDTVKELLEDYQDKFKSEAQDAQEKARKAMQDAQESGDMAAGMRGAMAPIQEFRATAAKLDQGFSTQFKGVLTAEQAAQWPTVERAQRRDRASSGANFGANVLGERVDLVQILSKINLSEETRQSIAPVLKQYEMDLDKQLIERNKVSDQAAADMMAARGGDMMQMRDAIQAIMANMRDAGFKVAEVNRRYAEKIRTMLPEDRRPTFARAVKEAKFADVYRASDGARAIDAALGFEDLSAEQKAKIQAIKEKYAKDVASVNDRLAVATEQNEVARATSGNGRGAGGPGGGRGPGGGQNGGQGGNQGNGRGGRGGNQGAPPGNANGGNGFPGRSGPMADLMREKRTLDQDTLESLKNVLTPEQQAKLPRSQRGPGGGPGGFGPGNGGGNQPARGG